MKNTDNLIHTRYVCNSILFHKRLLELGFVLDTTHGKGSREIRSYKKDKKYVLDTNTGLQLYTKENDSLAPDITYDGYTVSDQILKFFAQRTPTKII